MACDLTTNQEWTLDVELDPPAVQGTRTIVFCILVDGDRINGKVDVISNDEAVFLSNVTGRNQVLTRLISPDPMRPVRLMTLNFTWGTTNVVLSGAVFPEGLLNRFEGRLSAFGSAEPGAQLTEDESSAPRGNDTGTATGTQT